MSSSLSSVVSARRPAGTVPRQPQLRQHDASDRSMLLVTLCLPGHGPPWHHGEDKEDISMAVDRRTFVKGALGASGAALLGGMGRASSAEPRLDAFATAASVSTAVTALQAPGDSGI